MRKKVLILIKDNDCASLGGESGFLCISINSILSSSSLVNHCFLFLITSFLSHFGICCTGDFPLEDEGVFLDIPFLLSLLSGVFYLCECSLSAILVFVEPTILTSVSWEVCWGLFTYLSLF